MSSRYVWHHKLKRKHLCGRTVHVEKDHGGVRVRRVVGELGKMDRP